MVCSLVALSTTCTGVVTLPQSCSKAAMRSSWKSFSVMRTSLSGPVVVSFTASANIMVSSGTRWQWPPV